MPAMPAQNHLEAFSIAGLRFVPDGQRQCAGHLRPMALYKVYDAEGYQGQIGLWGQHTRDELLDAWLLEQEVIRAELNGYGSQK